MKKIVIPLMLLLTATTFAAERPNLNGKWNVHISMSGRESDQKCNFVLVGKVLTGTCNSAASQFQAGGTAQVKGILDGDRLTWTSEIRIFDDSMTMTSMFAATLVSPTKIAGTVEIQPLGFDGDFIATPLEEGGK